MSDNERFFVVFEHLKSKGLINTYVELAAVLGTNKAGINDLKSGKKKITVENIRSMKNSYPLINTDFIILENAVVPIEIQEYKGRDDSQINPEQITLEEGRVIYNSSTHIYERTIEAQQETIKAQATTIKLLEKTLYESETNTKSKPQAHSHDPARALS